MINDVVVSFQPKQMSYSLQHIVIWNSIPIFQLLEVLSGKFPFPFFFFLNYFIPFKLAFLCFAIFSLLLVSLLLQSVKRCDKPDLTVTLYILSSACYNDQLFKQAAHTIFAVCTNVCWVHSPAIFQRVLLTFSNLETDSNWVNYPVFFSPLSFLFYFIFYVYFRIGWPLFDYLLCESRNE